MFLLHAEGEVAGGFVSEVFGHGLLETLRIVPFLLITYLLIEYIEHRAKDRAAEFISRRGALAPVFGALVGAVPQCGFSAAASSLYSERIITAGTLIAVFLSTSDEMLPILISGNISIGAILAILGYKTLVAMVMGLLIDFVISKVGKKHRGCEEEHCHMHEACEEKNDCHCDDCCKGGIFTSALIHTLKISGFILLVTLIINSVMYFAPEEGLGVAIASVPVFGHLVFAIFGLVPNCAVSVALTTLAREGIISAGQMLSGLFSGAGVGLMVLLRSNRSRKENILIIAAILLTGVVFGCVGDLIMPNVLSW